MELAKLTKEKVEEQKFLTEAQQKLLNTKTELAIAQRQLENQQRTMAETELKVKSELKFQAEAALKTDQLKHNELAIESEEKSLEKKSAELRAQMKSEAEK